MRVLAAAAAIAGLAGLSAPAAAQAARRFPQNALRGVVAFDAPPFVRVNGQQAQMAPGVRIHGLDNMIKMSGALAGSQFVVNYTVERTSGLLQDIWLLRDDEAAVQPWPVSADQAAAWQFDPMAQTWTKP